MITRIIKTIIPTTKFPSTTNSPNDLISSPAAAVPSAGPRIKIFRVEATFNDNRNRVEIRRTEGKVEKSKGFLEYRAISMIITEVASDKASNKSRING